MLNFLERQWDKFIDFLKDKLRQPTLVERVDVEFKQIWKDNAVYPGAEELYVPKAFIVKKVKSFKALFDTEISVNLFWDLGPTERWEQTTTGDFIRSCVFNVDIPYNMFWYSTPVPDDAQDLEIWESFYRAFKRHQVSVTLDLLSRGLIQMSDLTDELYSAVVMHEPAPTRG